MVKALFARAYFLIGRKRFMKSLFKLLTEYVSAGKEGETLYEP